MTLRSLGKGAGYAMMAAPLAVVFAAIAVAIGPWMAVLAFVSVPVFFAWVAVASWLIDRG